jgi:hypothetical protein
MKFEDGKYEIVRNGSIVEVLRYGNKWRDLTGDKFVNWLIMRIEELELELQQSKNREKHTLNTLHQYLNALTDKPPDEDYTPMQY